MVKWVAMGMWGTWAPWDNFAMRPIGSWAMRPMGPMRVMGDQHQPTTHNPQGAKPQGGGWGAFPISPWG